MGRSSDSHSSATGGTIVTKDSDGNVRAFLGHVCGSGNLHISFNTIESVQEFYDSLIKFNFLEYKDGMEFLQP